MSWQLIVVAAIGASLGSFLNVLIVRFRKAGARLTDRSACQHCGKTLRWWELIPVVSCIALRSRCARCRHPISWQYPLVEILTAAAWLWVFAVTPVAGLLSHLALAGILTVLILLWAIDGQHLLLPDIYIVYLALFVIAYLWVNPSSAGSPLLGALVGSGILLGIWTVTRGRGLGFGDVKLALPLGLLLGTQGIIATLMLAFMAGGVSAGYLLLSRQASMKTAVPFGPYVIAAAMAVIVEPRLPVVLFALLPA